jgi:hypothetical protein
MNLLSKITGKVKQKANIRYIEVEGICFAVGIDYVIELTKEYNRTYNVDAGIDEVLSSCFGNAKVTADALNKIILALKTSINMYNKAVGNALITDSDVKGLIDTKGFGAVGKIILAIASTLTALMVKGSEESVNESDNSEKKS